MKSKRRLLLIASAAALVLVGLVVWLSQRHVQLYKVTVLPPLGGATIQPTAINDHGQIVGTAEGPAGQYHAFLWDRNNGLKDLGVGGSNDINNAAQIAGTLRDPNGNHQAFFWDPSEGKQMLTSPGGTWSSALALNNRGQVVGYYNTAKDQPQAFIWDRINGMQNLPHAAHPSGRATEINDSGQVMGFVGPDGDPTTPCLWDSTDPAGGSVAKLLSPLTPRGSDLNNKGYILCRAYALNKDRWWASRWRQKTGLEYLFPIEQPVGILKFNDANQVLYGEKNSSPLARISRKYFGPRTQYCIWDPKRGRIVLDKQVPREAGKLIRVCDVNNRGCTVGVIQSKGLGQEFAVLLEPIPERWGK